LEKGEPPGVWDRKKGKPIRCKGPTAGGLQKAEVLGGRKKLGLMSDGMTDGGDVKRGKHAFISERGGGAEITESSGGG